MSRDTRQHWGQWGEQVRRARLNAGLTQRELAEKALMDHSHLSRLENGHAGVGDQTRLRLAKALKVPVHSLFGYDEVQVAS